VASGTCVNLVPEVFALDSTGAIQVLDERPVGEQLQRRCREAERSCPASAISIVDEVDA
jgi:ferredoxin